MSGLEPDVARGGTDGTVKVKWVQPPPLVINRDWLDTDPPMPNAAATLRKKAEAAGWTVRVTYAQGVHPPKRGTTEAVIIHSCGVRMSRGSQRAYSAWEAPTVPTPCKWSSGMNAIRGGWLAPHVTPIGIDLNNGIIKPFGFLLTSTELSDFIQLPEITRTVILDSHYEQLGDNPDFIPLSLFKEFIGEPARLRAIANAEKKAKKAKANPDATASLVETFDPIGDSP